MNGSRRPDFTLLKRFFFTLLDVKEPRTVQIYCAMIWSLSLFPAIRFQRMRGTGYTFGNTFNLSCASVTVQSIGTLQRENIQTDLFLDWTCQINLSHKDMQQHSMPRGDLDLDLVFAS